MLQSQNRTGMNLVIVQQVFGEHAGGRPWWECSVFFIRDINRPFALLRQCAKTSGSCSKVRAK